MLKVLRAFPIFLVAFIGFAASTPVRADTDAESLLERARLTYVSMYNDTNYPQLKRYINLGKAVLIFPGQLKAAFIVGAQGGSGVLVARDINGVWGYPAFYTAGAGSLGLQIGFQSSETVLVIMTEKGLDAIINNQVKLGADASVAIGPVGIGAQGATTTAVGADIVAFSRNEGLYAGGSIDGSVIVKRDDWNSEFYGPGATPRGIVLEQKFSTPKADRFRESLQSTK
ncbi:MAG TPA: lipid-binding SYLF domain-containing protein [Alphaproteobacteria bacterium]|nr:lipid-binding SYLF domain-containing protein [Alphaproteobacteria bacterium]